MIMSVRLAKDQELGESYIKFPNGLMMAWGSSFVAENVSGKQINFPVAFAEVPRVFPAVIYDDSGNINTMAIIRNGTTTSFYCYVYDQNQVYKPQRRFNWFAIGKWK